VREYPESQAPLLKEVSLPTKAMSKIYPTYSISQKFKHQTVNKEVKPVKPFINTSWLLAGESQILDFEPQGRLDVWMI
jgi:hypothetical protein